MYDMLLSSFSLIFNPTTTECATRYRTRHFLIILPLMRILQRNLKRTTDTFFYISRTTNVFLF